MLWNSINLIWMRPRAVRPEELAAVAADGGASRPLRSVENGLGVLPICVLDMVCRLMEPVRNDRFHLLTIVVIDPCEEPRSKCYDGYCEVSVPWNMEGFSERDDLSKKQEIVLILEAGLRMMSREYDVDSSSALDACRMVREVGYRNVWMMGRKRSKEGMEAVVTAECSTEQTVVTLAVFQKRGQLIRRERVVDLGPESGGLKQQYLSELLWEGGEVILRGKFGFEYRLDVLAGERGRVRYALRPYEQVGSIIVGFLGPAMVPWAVGREPKEVLYDGSRVVGQIFEDMRVWFSQEGKCVRVDFSGSADLRCGGAAVLGRTFEEIVAELREIDEDAEVRESAVVSKGLGLTIVCQNGESGLVDEAHVYCVKSWATKCAEMFED